MHSNSRSRRHARRRRQRHDRDRDRSVASILLAFVIATAGAALFMAWDMITALVGGS